MRAASSRNTPGSIVATGRISLKRLVLLSSLCLWGGAALAQDQVSLDFRWPDAARWRVVEQWELEVVSPDGQKEIHSGVVRGLWTLDRSSGAPVVSGRQAVVVRTTPRTDADAIAIAKRLVAPWSVDLSPRTAPAPAPEAPVVPALPADVAEAPVVDPATPAADGAPVVEAPPVVEAAPVVAAPPAVVVPTTFDRPDIAALVAGDPADQVDRIFRAFDDQTLTVSTDFFVDATAASGATGAAVPAEVRRRVDRLQWCSDRGPGSSCVELGLRSQQGGAPAEGLRVPAGARRTTETWVVEPATLVPHSARVETVVGWDGAGGVWHARVTKMLTFLPADPPRALQLH